MTKKIIILHDNNEWLKPIEESFKKYGLDYEEFDLQHGLIDLDKVPEDAIFFNRVSPSSHLRDRPYAIEHALNFLKLAELHGRKIINGVNSVYLELNKFAQYLSLQKSGAKIPKTIAAIDKHDILEAARQIEYPLIIKPNRGGSGDGVEIFYEEAALKIHLQTNFKISQDGITLVQKYIKPKNDVITRVEFINKELLYAVKITVSGDFHLCPADACQIDTKHCAIDSENQDKFVIDKNFDHPILEKYKDFFTREKYDIGAIEFVEDENDEIYSYDVNSNTNYNCKAQAKAGISGHDILVERLFK